MISITRKTIIIAVAIVASLVYWIQEETSVAHTQMFCAYGKWFVEFKEGNSVWGAMLLDDDGRPIRCSKSDTAPFRQQGII